MVEIIEIICNNGGNHGNNEVVIGEIMEIMR
jgi:hypothetical protein